MLLQIIPLLLIFSCNQQQKTPSTKEEDKETTPVAESTTKPDKCAINMAKLAILVQEYAFINGKMTVDDDVDCPTDEQLQEMRNAILAGKKQVADQKLKERLEKDKRDEDRVREWAGWGRRTAVVFRIGANCYVCDHGDIPMCRQNSPEKLKQINCQGQIDD